MFSCQNILTATGGRLIGGECRTLKGVSIDSRAIKRGECFVAIKGERFDGHDFLREAVKNGAGGLVVSRDVPRRIFSRTGAAIFRVDDTLRALGDIAHFHRMRFDIPVVAITGSNGKTTAKEMVAAVLRNGWRPLKSAGTENNLIGVPLTLLRMNGRHGSAVLEFGMNRAGEIARLAEIAAPNIGVIMNVAPAHSGFFRDIGAIFRAKRELFDAIGRWDTAVINSGDARLARLAGKGKNAVTFAIDGIAGRSAPRPDFRATGIKVSVNGWSFTVNGRHPFEIGLLGRHNIENALAAVTIGRIFNLSMDDIARSLKRYRTVGRRLALKKIKGVTIIDDSYNANPASLEAAIRSLLSYGKGVKRRILVAGDMLELGKRSASFHEEVGRLAARARLDTLLTLGKAARHTQRAARRSGLRESYYCKSNGEAIELLKRMVKPGDAVLFKGSRGMRVDEVVDGFVDSLTKK